MINNEMKLEFGAIVLDNEISKPKHEHHLNTWFVYKYRFGLMRSMVRNATFNNISVISWPSGLLALIYIAGRYT